MENQEFEIEDGVLKKYHEQEGKTTVVVPDGVTTIGDSAFMNCKNLIKIVLPDSVTIIDCKAFFKCTNLRSINIPGRVKDVGGFAFTKCFNLRELILPNLDTMKLIAADLKLISINTIIKNYKNKKQEYSMYYIYKTINFIIVNKMIIIELYLDNEMPILDLIHFMLNDMGDLYTSEEIEKLLKLTKEKDIEVRVMLLEYKKQYLGFNQNPLNELTLGDDEETKGKTV